MVAKGTGKSKAQATHFAPYTAGCYPVPIRFLYGTAAEINFWDVVYYRAYMGHGTFDTSTLELTEQTGLTRQMIGQLRHEASRHGDVLEDIALDSGRRFRLIIPYFDPFAKGFIWKPRGYVLTPAIPKRVLNLYLQQPRQRIYQLAPRYIAAKCQRQFPYRAFRSFGPLNAADVSSALRLLTQLGLLVPAGDGFRIEWAVFNQPAPIAPACFNSPDLHDHPLFVKHAALDPARAERALELVLIGRYDFDVHFTAIFDDLTYLHDDNDYCLLRRKVQARRAKLPGPKRWQETWRVFQRELKRRVAERRFPKVALDLGEAAPSIAPLPIAHDLAARSVAALVTIARVEWPWYVQAAAPVHLDMLLSDRVLFTRSLNIGEGEVRFTLPPDQWTEARHHLAMRVRYDQPMPGVRVEAWVEAKLQR